MQKKFIRICSLTISILLSAAAFADDIEKNTKNVYDEINSCGGDNTCLTRALARLIISHVGGSAPGSGQLIYFYRSDSCGSNFIRHVRLGTPIDTCERLAQTISDRVWGIRYEGQPCLDISDLSFREACIRYAAE